MKIINKKTGNDVTSKVIKIIEKSLEKSGFKIVSKSPYRDKNGNFLNTNKIRLVLDNINVNKL